MGGHLGVLTQDVSNHRTAHIQGSVEFVVHDTLGNYIHSLTYLATDVEHHDTLDFWHADATGLDCPPIGIQIKDLLICIPQHEVVGTRMWHIITTFVFIDVIYLRENVCRHNRNACVELQRQHLELKSGCWHLEVNHYSLVIHCSDLVHKLLEISVIGQLVVVLLALKGEDHILGSDRSSVTPLGHCVELDGQLCVVTLCVLHAVSQPRNFFIIENTEVG